MTRKEKFNEKMVTIGNYIFDLQFIITGLVCDILDEMNRESLDINLDFSCIVNNSPAILTSEKISYDSIDEKLYILTIDGRMIQWLDLDVSVQEQFAQEVHMEYVSEVVFKDLSVPGTGDESH